VSYISLGRIWDQPDQKKQRSQSSDWKEEDEKVKKAKVKQDLNENPDDYNLFQKSGKHAYNDNMRLEISPGQVCNIIDADFE
jgi:hypothetical protein